MSLFSMGGHRMVPSADEHFYCATKYAVTALTEGIRQELREANTHIRATVSWRPPGGRCGRIHGKPNGGNACALLQCISPGIVETEFAFRHHNSDPEKAAAVYESMKVRAPASRRAALAQTQEVAQPSSLPPAVFEGRRRSQRRHVRLKRPPSRAGSPPSLSTAAVNVASGLMSPVSRRSETCR